MGITSQLAEFRDLTRQMLAELKAVRALLEKQEERRAQADPLCIEIDESVLQRWRGQEGQECE